MQTQLFVNMFVFVFVYDLRTEFVNTDQNAWSQNMRLHLQARSRGACDGLLCVLRRCYKGQLHVYTFMFHRGLVMGSVCVC